jgi:hypothetical protein
VSEDGFSVQAERRPPSVGLSVAAVVTMVPMVAVMPAVVPVLRRDGGRGAQDGGHRQDAQNLLHR